MWEWSLAAVARIPDLNSLISDSGESEALGWLPRSAETGVSHAGGLYCP